MPRERASVTQNPKCYDGNRHSYINICLTHLDLSTIKLLSDHLMVLQRLLLWSKHSNSPTHLWFHLGRWLRSQLYVPSGHRWSIPVKKMCAISRQEEAKFCLPQEWKERLHLVANCKVSGKTCSCSRMAGNAKGNHEPKEFKLLWRSSSANYGDRVTNSDCRLSAGFTWPTWLIFFVAVVLLPEHTLQHIFITEQTIITKLVLIKEEI